LWGIKGEKGNNMNDKAWKNIAWEIRYYASDIVSIPEPCEIPPEAQDYIDMCTGLEEKALKHLRLAYYYAKKLYNESK
jgi:hypothetical protein